MKICKTFYYQNICNETNGFKIDVAKCLKQRIQLLSLRSIVYLNKIVEFNKLQE